jgi:hypothetical protein
MKSGVNSVLELNKEIKNCDAYQKNKKGLP